MSEQREHALMADCWCHPIVLAYGDRCVYDSAGNLVTVTRADGEVVRVGQRVTAERIPEVER